MGCESLLERDRVLLVDFDPDVTGIASQPFGISGILAGKERHHGPDYLLVGSSGTLVVDVKPARLLKRAEVTELLEWTESGLGSTGITMKTRGHRDSGYRPDAPQPPKARSTPSGSLACQIRDSTPSRQRRRA